MISKEDIKKLSELARIEVRESEAEKLQHDLERVLEYVEQLSRAQTGTAETLIHANKLSNVAADDGALLLEFGPESGSLMVNAFEHFTAAVCLVANGVHCFDFVLELNGFCARKYLGAMGGGLLLFRGP